MPNYIQINDYQNWEPGLYLIDAPCGSGKSSFVFGTLYHYVHANQKKMLVFSNRVALRQQQELQALDTDITCITY